MKNRSRNINQNIECPQAQSLKNQKWAIKSYDDRHFEKFLQQSNLSDIEARLLYGRIDSADKIHSFMRPTLRNSMPDPYHLKDMKTAVDHIFNAICKKQKIAVFGDYDVDGATSSALIKRFFQTIHYDLVVYIPDRIKEGYGPTIEGFSYLKEQNIDVIVTVDCGTLSFEPIAYAKEQDMVVIVIDHHASDITLPPAHAVINPNRRDEDSQYGYLAAVGVTFLLLAALHSKLRLESYYDNHNIQEPNFLGWLDIVALGTVCDVVPLVGLNRAFVSQGLKILNKKKNIGLKNLAQVAAIQQAVTSYHLGYVLGPRINAGGRVGTSSLGSLLLSLDKDEETQKISFKLDKYNAERRDIERNVLEEAMDMALQQSSDNAVLVVAKKGWHQGVIGIVASRLKERFNRPSIVIAIDENGYGKGSGRSIKGFDLGKTIIAAQQSSIIDNGGGHPMAAGLSLSENKIEALQLFVNTKFEDVFGVKYDFTGELYIDGVLGLGMINDELLNFLDKLSPYGAGNVEPKFLIPNVKIQNPKIVGGQHISLNLNDFRQNRVQAICFGSVNTDIETAFLTTNQTFDVVGTLKMNHWNGYSKPQFQILDARYAVSTV